MTKTMMTGTLLAALTGCTATYKEPVLPADHPANAAGMDSQPLARSHTLDLAAAEPVTQTPADPSMEPMDHGVETPAPKSPPGDQGAAHQHHHPGGDHP